METKVRKRNLIKKAPPKSNPKKLSLYFVIVNKGQGDAVVKLFASRFKTSLTYLHKGEGTATDKVSEILGFNDNRKDVVVSVIKRDELKEDNEILLVKIYGETYKEEFNKTFVDTDKITKL